MSHPVEAGAKVVYKFLAWELLSNLACKGCCFRDAGVGCLNPKEIGIGCEFLATLGSGLDAGGVVVETFASARNVPVKVYGALGVVVCDCAALEEGEGASLEFVDAGGRGRARRWGQTFEGGGAGLVARVRVKRVGNGVHVGRGGLFESEAAVLECLDDLATGADGDQDVV